MFKSRIFNVANMSFNIMLFTKIKLHAYTRGLISAIFVPYLDI